MNKQREAHAAAMRAWQRRTGWTKCRRYDEVGAIADEITGNCFGSPSDHRRWAARLYDYPWAVEAVLARAYALASHFRRGTLRNPVTAFQAWLDGQCPDLRKTGGAW